MTFNNTNPQVDAYITRLDMWQPETLKLRTLLLDCGLTEEFKWGKPCYTAQGKNIAIIQGFKAYFALLFFKGYLLHDLTGILVKTGPDTHVGRKIRFASVHEIESLEPHIRAYIHEAIEIEKNG